MLSSWVVGHRFRGLVLGWVWVCVVVCLVFVWLDLLWVVGLVGLLGLVLFVCFLDGGVG